MSWDPEVALRGIKTPVEIISTPVMDGPAALHRLNDALPHELIDDAGHWVQLEKPKEIAARIDAFALKIGAKRVQRPF